MDEPLPDGVVKLEDTVHPLYFLLEMKGKALLSEGDWIVVHRSGMKEVMGDKLFRKEYELCK